MVTERFKVPYEIFSRIVRARTMRMLLNHVIAWYWKQEERLNLYREIESHVGNGKLVAAKDILEIKSII